MFFRPSIFPQRQYILTTFLLFSLLFSPTLHATDRIDVSEKTGETSFIANMRYEYDDKDIKSLLLLRAQEESLDLNRTILMHPLHNETNQIEEQLHKERVLYGERVLEGKIKPVARTILTPINLNNIHWVGLIVRLNERNQVLRIQYIDSLGDSIFEDSIPEEIQSALKKVYGEEVHIKNLLLLRQTDGVAYGVLTVENLIRAAQEHLDIELISEETTKLMRNHHIALLEQFRPDLHFNIKQKDSVVNNITFQFFSPGRLIFLLGTSSSGKTSIVEYIKNKAQLQLNNKNLIITSTDTALALHYLYAYLLYSPSDLNFLHRYFTNEEILGVIENPALLSELISKTSIAENEKRSIQSIFEEFSANQEKIIQRFHSPAELPYFNSLSFLSALISGKTVIIDTISLDDFFQVMTMQLLHCRTDVVIVHCPPKQLIERLYHRNTEAVRTGNLNNCRPGAFPLRQYVKLYEPTVFSNQSIDSIDLSNIQIPKELPEACKVCLERRKQLSLYQENQWSEAIDLIQNSFGINANEDKVFIKPKHDYHFFVNTEKEDAATCSEKLLKALEVDF